MKSKLDDKNEWSVYFTTESLEFAFDNVSSPAIVFSPSRDKWNDFNYRCRYDFTVFQEGVESNFDGFEGSLFLGFTGKDHRVLEDGLIEISESLVSAKDLPPYFTLLGGMNEYRKFISELGVGLANQLLLKFHDLVALRRPHKQPAWMDEALKSKAFNLAFMRNAEPFYAFHNAGSLLDGLDREEFRNMSEDLSLVYDLDGFKGRHQLKLRFDHDDFLPKRINVLIGRNGLGKSQALSAIVRSLVRGDKQFIDPELGRPLINRVLAIATPGETVNTFPPERKNKRIQYKRLIMSRSSSSKSSRGFGEMCIQLARSPEQIGGNERWGLFLKVLKELDQMDGIVLPLKDEFEVRHGHLVYVRGKTYIPLSKLNRGGEQARLEAQGAVPNKASPMRLIGDAVHPLSSGQSAFLKFAVQACLFIENGTLVLLDEPETHLHPNFIAEFVRLLDRLLVMTGSAAVIATHSAYFVREMPRTQVLVFKEGEDNVVHIENPRLKTFGADIGSISFFVFEDEITSALVEGLVERLPKSKEQQAKIVDSLQEELSAEVIMYLRRELGLVV